MKLREKGEGFPGQRIVVLPRDVIAGALRQPLLKNLLPTDVGFFPRANGHLRERRRGVDQAIFIFCAKGSGWCELPGGRHEVRHGELLVVPRDTAHTYGADKKGAWTIYWFHAVGENLKHFLEQLGCTAEKPVLWLGDAPELLTLFEEVLGAVEHGYAPIDLLYASHALAHLIVMMIQLRRANWGSNPPDSSQRIAQSISFMKHHLSDPLPVPKLASVANLSVSHYAALFKKETGYSPTDFFIRLRMHRACQWLDTTGWSVKQIAWRLGYEDPLYFSRVFRGVNDVSPSQYRKMRKG